MKFQALLLSVLSISSTVALATSVDTAMTFTPFYMAGYSSSTIAYGNSHAGYGYITSSDTNAEMQFNSSCEPQRLQGVVSDDAAVLQSLRDRVFEYLTYETAALNPAQRPVPISVPACVRPNSAGPLMVSLLPTHAPTDLEVGATQNPILVRLMKFRGVWAQTRPFSAIFAVVFDDLLKSRETFMCNCDPKLESNCLDARYSRLRLKGTFSFLFESAKAESAKASIRTALINVLGAESAFQSGNASADVVALGTAAYSQMTSVVNSMTFQDGLEKAILHGMELSAPANLRQALKDLLSVGQDLWKQKRSSLLAETDAICSLTLPDIATRYPNVVRQVLLDTSTSEAQTIRASMCSVQEFKDQLRKISCAGVTGGPLPGPIAVQVNRRASEFPFASINMLSLTQPTAADPVVLHLRVHFNFDSDISADEVTQTLTRWQSNANTWYSCQVGAGPAFSFDNNYLGQSTSPPFTYTCPAGYSMKDVGSIGFDIQYTADSQPVPADGPQVAVHRCYRMEIKSSDCAQVRDFAVQSCTAKCASSDLTCAQQCASKQIGDLANNRANSGHFILGQQLGTLLHETGHLLGLDDEYLDPQLPFAPLGRPRGIMTNSHAVDPRLDITHIRRMLEPLSCH